jgi:hypothetical protein
MQKSELDFLKDVQAFIEHGIKNGLTFEAIVCKVATDLRAVRSQEYSLGVFGYRNIGEDDFGESGT